MEKIRIDLGCGERKRVGFIGIDSAILPGVDIVCDLERGIPLKDGSVREVYANYFFEHVRNLIFLFQEVFRVCQDGAKVEMVVPYYSSINAFKDPTHRNFFTEETFKYFSREKWYGSDYKINTDFRVVNIKYHYSRLIQPWVPFKKYLRRYFLNTASAMTVELEVVKQQGERKL